MISIFYDLETTDLYTTGQILQIAMVVVDENWKVLGTFDEKIQIASTILPTAKAILVNRINVLDHQAAASKNEMQVMAEAHAFIRSFEDTTNSPIYMIGYNNLGFDLRFLRTSMIRNGLNPYFGRRFVNRDVLHCVRRLFLINTDFRDAVSVIRGEHGGASLKMNDVCACLGVSDGDQTHQALDDTMLTIELAKHLQDRWGVDVRTQDSYDLEAGEELGCMTEVYRMPTGKELDMGEVSSTRLVFLKKIKNYSVWFDLDAAQGLPANMLRNAIKMMNTGTAFSVMKAGPIPVEKAEHMTDELVLELFDRVLPYVPESLEDFYGESQVDIEANIYALPFKAIELIRKALWEKEYDIEEIGKLKGIHRTYLTSLVGHAHIKYGNLAQSAKLRKKFREYVEVRYRGYFSTMMVARGVPHPSFNSMFCDIKHYMNSECSNEDDRELMIALLAFYGASDVNTYAGDLLKE